MHHLTHFSVNHNSKKLLGIRLATILMASIQLHGCGSPEHFTDMVDTKTGLSISETKLTTALKKQLGREWAPDLPLTKLWRQSVSRTGANPIVTAVAGNNSTVYFYRDSSNNREDLDSAEFQEDTITNAVRFFGPVDVDCRAVYSETPFKWGIYAHAIGKHILPADDQATQIKVFFREDPSSEKAYGWTHVNEASLSDSRSYSMGHPWEVDEGKRTASTGSEQPQIDRKNSKTIH